MLSAVSIWARANWVKANSKIANSQIPTPISVAGNSVPFEKSFRAMRVRAATASQVTVSNIRRLVRADL